MIPQKIERLDAPTMVSILYRIHDEIGVTPSSFLSARAMCRLWIKAIYDYEEEMGNELEQEKELGNE